MPASDATKSKEVVAVEAELARAKAEPHKDVPYLKALKSLITALTELSQKEADFTAKKTELEVGHLFAMIVDACARKTRELGRSVDSSGGWSARDLAKHESKKQIAKPCLVSLHVLFFFFLSLSAISV